jgi:hypothetical protein
MLNLFLTPDTVDYMIAGYAVLTVILTVYLLSIFLRWRKAKAEYKLLQED